MIRCCALEAWNNEPGATLILCFSCCCLWLSSQSVSPVSVDFSNANLIISSIWGHTWPELKKSIRKPKTERYKTKTNWPVPSSHWKWARRKLEVPQVRRQGQAAKKKKNRFLANGTFFAHPLDRSLPLVEGLEKCRNYVISPWCNIPKILRSASYWKNLKAFLRGVNRIYRFRS